MFSISKLPRLGRREARGMDRRRKSKSSSRGPRLDRRNAVKNIDYDAAASPCAGASASWGSSSSDESPAAGCGGGAAAGLRTRSLDLSPSTCYSIQKSFRIEGVDGEVDLLCRSLGLSGPEDFAIPAAAWEARKALSSSDLLPPSRLLDDAPSAEDPPNEDPKPDPPQKEAGRVKIKGARPPPVLSSRPPPPIVKRSPSSLAPPPFMSLPAHDNQSSTWDLVRSFGPDNGVKEDMEEEEEVEEEEEAAVNVVVEEVERVGETVKNLIGSSSFYATTDDEASSTTTETMFMISPNGKFKRNIRSWMRGDLLGSGSFGMVYEAISDDGFFFAVKEVSLLDQGSNAKQCITQLEQEIALLSQFEHENIVQYFGTDKEEAKLYIFIELVTQGSLASLYHKYNLRDSQVSAYTRQILSGLDYLHERNVVHRDIKCANILVDASGSVKLADFGLAKEITKLNMLKSCKGSVYWMAPEVVNPKRTYGPAADIWSLGCTVLEMLTRQIPYPNLEWTQALFRIGRGEPPLIPTSLSKDACDFIQQCVRVNPEDRPSAAELLEHPFVRRPLPSPGSSDVSRLSDRR